MKPGEQSSSGNPPERKKPTVITAPQSPESHARRTPKVIVGTPTSSSMASPSGENNALKPTVVRAVASAAAPPPKPTRIIRTEHTTVTDKQVHEMSQAQIGAATPTAARPTVVPGKIIKYLAVTMGDLRSTNPNASLEVLEAARARLQTVCVDTLSEADCLRWGEESQKEHAACITDSLRLSEDTTVSDTIRTIGNLQETLSGIDLELVLGLKEPGWFGKSREKINSEWEGTKRSIAQYAAALKVKERPLEEHRLSVMRLKERYEHVGRRIEAEIVAAVHIADVLRKQHGHNDRIALANLMEQSSMRLAQTLGQIRGNGPLLDTQADQPMRLINCIQNAILVDVQGWLSSYAAIKGAAGLDGKVSKFELDELNRGKETVQEKLKLWRSH